LHGLYLGVERMMATSPRKVSLPVPLRQAITFVLVLITWVFFRADSLPAAMAYLGSMLGVVPVPGGAGLIGGLIYQPFYAGAMALAAILTWGGTQTWTWTRTLPGWKLAVILLLFGLSVTLLAAQAYNPFIYFIF
jgi:alginate O-acetyltransferase complex protein AlgI